MSFTNLNYTEFDSNSETLVSDLVAAIVASASWTQVNAMTSLVTTATTGASAGGTTLTAASGSWTSAGITVGQVVRIGEWGAADMEFRTVTAVAATTITIAALTYAHTTGTKVYIGNTVLKATTTRGADMIVDLTYAHYTVLNTGLNMAVYRAYSGTGLGTPTDISQRWLYWKNSAATAAAPIHCTVSVSKDHLFIQLEGPRENETGADSATLGSSKNYFFMDDLVPYFVGDTVPAIVAGGGMSASATASTTVSHLCHQSRNPANTSSWEQSKLGTVAHPDNGLALSQQHQRIASLDSGNYWLSPYVCFGDISGPRGRLGHIFFAGFLNPDYLDSVVSSPAIGSKVTYGGDTYKLLSANRSGANINSWGQLGALGNASGNPNNLVIAVPST